MTRRLPWIVAALAAGAALAPLALPRLAGEGAAAAFGRLPVLHNGRMKPLDTVARTSLLLLQGRQTLPLGERRMEAVEWLLDVLARPEAADSYKVFRIDDADVLGMLRKPVSGERYLSFKDLDPFVGEIASQAEAAQAVPAPARSRFQSAAFHLQERLLLYHRLKHTLQSAGTEDLPAEIETYGRVIAPGIQALLAQQRSAPHDPKALQALGAFFMRYRFLSQMAVFRSLPPLEGEPPELWVPMGEGLLQALRTGRLRPGIAAYAGMMRAWRVKDADAFGRAASDLEAFLKARSPREEAFARYEVLFNRAGPFATGMALYLAVFLIACASWLAWPEALQRASFALLLVAFGVHTAGLLTRIVLQGRPPVTNLYSSAVFVGWVAALLGIVLERLTRRGFGSAVASAVGFATLLIAHHLSGRGDTLEMMQAVLDSNFWLGTHVVTITIGYGSTFLAGTLAHVYILRGLLTRGLNRDAARTLARMAYGVVCFSLLFSFVGTVLGGIWADQSWGRFWGWDPKENGALLIVLWNAIILHTRWGGFIRERGLMVMAVLGNIVTSLSWFGVNMLGIGLHSYGWTDKAFFWLACFVAGQLAVAALGCLPLERWLSFRHGELPHGLPQHA